MSPSDSLTAVDRAILEEVREYWPEGISGRDLAPLVDVAGRSIGSRLVSLTKRGLLRGERYAGMTNWHITPAGENEIS